MKKKKNIRRDFTFITSREKFIDYNFYFMMIICLITDQFKIMALVLFEDDYTFIIIIICAIRPGGTRYLV